MIGLDVAENAVRYAEQCGAVDLGLCLDLEGLFHADLFISRPPSEIERLPIQNLVSVVSGANKPWRVGTNVLGGMARTAEPSARARRARVSVVRGS